MTLDNEQQRSILLQALDIAAKAVVTGANNDSLQALVELSKVRLATQNATIAEAKIEAS